MRVVGEPQACEGGDGLQPVRGHPGGDALHALVGAGGPQKPVLGAQRWGPENIPAFLPEDWYTRYFTPIGGVNPTLTRRTAALRLVQMVAGGSLGIPQNRDHPCHIPGPDVLRGGQLYSGARQQPDPLGFETALGAIRASGITEYTYSSTVPARWISVVSSLRLSVPMIMPTTCPVLSMTAVVGVALTGAARVNCWTKA